ncbi:MAG: hypothetical protein N2Z21_05640, partial [Candidatus Sumerlaeaceae bacterium]|nr:hypothetical protein [Candidatus Sumerlaeaceae bacterium]
IRDRVYTGATIAATIISLPGPIIWLIGLKYGQFSVEICPSELIVRRGSQTRAIPADSIAEVSVARRYPPKWLLALYALAALLSPRYSGTFLIAGSRGNPILRLVLKNGAWVEFSHEMLQGMDKLKSWFLQHNIPTAEPLRSVKKEDVSRGTMLLSPILLHPGGSVRISYVHLLLGTTGLVWSAFWLSQWNPLPPL